MAGSSKPRILIVDGMPENIDFLQRSVSLSGERALKIADSEPVPDLILLDITMPGLDGYQVCRRLKQNGRTRDIPVIFVTALDEKRDVAAKVGKKAELVLLGGEIELDLEGLSSSLALPAALADLALLEGLPASPA